MTTKLREPVNGLTHAITAVVALGGVALLLVLARGDAPKMISLLIYGICLILLFAASGIYHMVNGGPKVLRVLRKMDHSAIYLLIAGTYTPICYNLLTGFWHWGLLAVIWGLALIGIGVNIFYINAPRWLTAGVYVLMGWLCILGVQEMIARMPAGALVWLIAGGVLYTLGAVVYSTKWMNFVPGKFGFHEVWHIFVILGALAHYVMVAVYIAAA